MSANEARRVRLADYITRCPLRKREDNWVENEKGEISIVDPVEGIPYWLNSTGSELWRMCNGKHTMKSILEKFLETYQVDRETLTKETLSLLLSLEKLGFIEFR